MALRQRRRLNLPQEQLLASLLELAPARQGLRVGRGLLDQRFLPALQLLDHAAARGGQSLTAATVREQLGLSPQATSNALARAVRDGVLDRVSSGTYALRPIGMLGTRAASEYAAGLRACGYQWPYSALKRAVVSGSFTGV